MNAAEKYFMKLITKNIKSNPSNRSNPSNDA